MRDEVMRAIGYFLIGHCSAWLIVSAINGDILPVVANSIAVVMWSLLIKFGYGWK